MDRSFLSKADVVTASRNFVCVRLATYESSSEGEFLKSLFLGRTGQLENSIFVVLAPDGKTLLTRAAREPGWLYANSKEMADSLNTLSRRYTTASKAQLRLPTMANVRLGLNVAACDKLPLVVAFGRDRTQERSLVGSLSKLAWDRAFMGRAVYASSADVSELSAIGVSATPGYLVIAPDSYGQRGRILATIKVGENVELSLNKALSMFRPMAASGIRSHIESGRRSGAYWQTVIPVTDPGPPGRR